MNFHGAPCIETVLRFLKRFKRCEGNQLGATLVSVIQLVKSFENNWWVAGNRL